MSIQSGSVGKMPLGDWLRPHRVAIRLVAGLSDIAIRLRKWLVAQLGDHETASIFVRLIQSKHVAELQLIALIALFFAALSLIAIILAALRLWFSEPLWTFLYSHLHYWWLVWPVFFGDTVTAPPSEVR